jgi:hypothetical protein
LLKVDIVGNGVGFIRIQSLYTTSLLPHGNTKLTQTRATYFLARAQHPTHTVSLTGIDRLAARKAANAQKAASTSTSKQKGKNPAPQTNTVPAQPTNPAKEAMYDRLFTCKLPPPASIYFILIIDPAVMAGRNGKSDNNYKPRNNKGDLSEEEDDDFMDVNEDAASTSNVSYFPCRFKDLIAVQITKKRKIIVVDGVLPAPPTKKVCAILFDYPIHNSSLESKEIIGACSSSAGRRCY